MNRLTRYLTYRFPVLPNHYVPFPFPNANLYINLNKIHIYSNKVRIDCCVLRIPDVTGYKRYDVHLNLKETNNKIFEMNRKKKIFKSEH